MKWKLALAAALFAFGSVEGANAATYTWSYTTTQVGSVPQSGSGTLTIADQQDPSFAGGYDITAITGTWYDYYAGTFSITALSNFNGADNILYPNSSPDGSLFNFGGLSFVDSYGEQVNISFVGGVIISIPTLSPDGVGAQETVSLQSPSIRVSQHHSPPHSHSSPPALAA
jgi:hypothetical protein